MTKRRPKINLTPSAQPHHGDLEKLFATEGDAEQAAGLQLAAIRLDAISADPDQPRRSYDDQALTELSESIRQDGVIQPIEVTEVAPGQYRIVHGERRWRAARRAGLSTIPAVVRRRDYDALTRFVRQLVENIQREDLNDVDRAAGLLRLRELMQAELDAELEANPPPDDEPTSPWSRKVTWAKVGERLGYSRQRIHQLIKLLDLPEEIKEAVRTGSITERDTRIYQGLSTRQQKELWRISQREAWSAGEVRKVARQLKEAPQATVPEAIRTIRQPPAPAAPPPAPEVIRPVEAPRRSLALNRIAWAQQHLAELRLDEVSDARRAEVRAALIQLRNFVGELLATLDATDEEV